MIDTFTDLYLCCLTPEQHRRTCGYWYLVRNRSMPHTAFRTRAALLRWLIQRGLGLEQPIPWTRGTHQSQRIIGSYTEKMWLDTKGFGKLQGERIRKLSNGQYTMAVITVDEHGHRTVHHLNPNCRRPVYDYWETKELIELDAVIDTV